MQFDKSNTILEDVCALIGYTATSSLVDWFGGGNLAIPATIDESHPIARVIGLAAATRLVREWGGETLWLPLDYQRERNRRDRLIGLLIHLGLGTKQVATVAGMSEPHVQKIRVKLESENLLPLILRQAGVSQEKARKSWTKSPGRKGYRG